MASQFPLSNEGDGRMARFKLNWDAILAFAFWAITLAIFFFCASRAQAGHPCNQFFHQQVVAVAPVVAPVYYQAGVGIEQDALAAKVARIVVGQLRSELHAQGGQLHAQATSARKSAIAQHCAKCHSGPTPKAGIVYDGVTSLACVQVTAALRSLAKEEMPKDHKLTPDQKGAVMQELLDLEQPIDKPPPAPSVGELQ